MGLREDDYPRGFYHLKCGLEDFYGRGHLNCSICAFCNEASCGFVGLCDKVGQILIHFPSSSG